MGSQETGPSAVRGLIVPALFLLAAFVLMGVGWVFLTVKPFLIVVFPVAVLLILVAVISAVRRKDAMYINYGDRKETLEISDDETDPR